MPRLAEKIIRKTILWGFSIKTKWNWGAEDSREKCF
jgi:hypothetical protein